MIETLDDIIDELMDKIGVYGGHDEDETKPCRICASDILRERILQAVEIEQKLYKKE